MGGWQAHVFAQNCAARLFAFLSARAQGLGPGPWALGPGPGHGNTAREIQHSVRKHGTRHGKFNTRHVPARHGATLHHARIMES